MTNRNVLSGALTGQDAVQAALRKLAAKVDAPVRPISQAEDSPTDDRSRIQEVQALLRAMFGAHPVPMWICDADSGFILAVNDAAISQYGFSREAFLTLKESDLEAGGEGPREPASQGRHKRKCGDWIDVEVQSHELEFRGRRARLVMATDVTAPMRAKAQLKEQAALLDEANDAIIVRDLEDRVLYWNESATRVYEAPRERAMGRPMRSLVSRPDPLAAVAWSAAIAKGDWSGELTTVTASGREVVTATRLTLVRDELGAARSVLEITTDVTERKLLEAQFLRAQRLESLGMLATGIAHDLNNVLQPIVMAIDLLRDPTDLEQVREVGETLSIAASRGASMVRQVTMFSRGADGKKVAVHPTNVLKEVERIVHDSFPKNIGFVTSVASGVWMLMADPTQMHQVLLNLCVNARDAMPDGGELKVTVENVELDEHYTSMVRGVKPGGYVVFSVSDTGSGIPSEIQDKIFEPFFTTKDVGSGTGLGLSTVMVIARAHGGYVTLKSHAGRGTTFRVHIPRAKVSGTSYSAVAAPARKSEIPRGRGQCVLVVDDERNIRGITRHTLETYGYEVLAADNGAEAVAVFAQQRERIAVVLLDMMMPVMDGPATIHALRTMAPELPIIITSGMATEAHRDRAERLGVKHFLPKPYTAEVLLHAIHASIPT